MISFRQFLLEGAYQKNLPMFNFLDKLEPITHTNYFGGNIIGGSVEEWHDGSFNLKSESRQDILKHGQTISKEDAKKYNIKEGEIKPQIYNIVNYFKENPKKLYDLAPDYVFTFTSNDIIAPYYLLTTMIEEAKSLPTVWKQWLLRYLKAMIVRSLLGDSFAIINRREGRPEEYHFIKRCLKYIKVLLQESKKLSQFYPKDEEELIYKSYKALVTILKDVPDTQLHLTPKLITYNMWPTPPMPTHNTIKNIVDGIKHMLSLNYGLINDYDPTSKGLFDVERDLDWLERIWKKETKGATTIDDDTEVLFPVGDMEWHLVNRESCSKEGAAMGHCGNMATPSDGDRILSLRTKKDKVQYKPHVTFILRKDNTLGEMKGKENKKPTEKYHEAIVKLLTYKVNGDWLVSGIYGGGYIAHSNFSLNDLGEGLTNYLKSVRPDLYESESK